jgi:hypothetical protein
MQILCFLGCHKYRKLIDLTPGHRMIGCNRCKKRWAMSDQFEALVEWDDEIQELYELSGFKFTN